MNRKNEPDTVNLTPMIDIVFQMIIFFVFTLDLEREKFSEKIEPPDAKEAPELKEFGTNPPSIFPQVLADGQIQVGSAIYTRGSFRNLMKSWFNRHGREAEVFVYGDGQARHQDIRKVMDIASEAGFYKITVIGMIEKSPSG